VADYSLPDRITFQQGAALGVPYGTAWRALFIRASARGERCWSMARAAVWGMGAVDRTRARRA
jgi:NADPH2:quinone reductase